MTIPPSVLSNGINTFLDGAEDALDKLRNLSVNLPTPTPNGLITAIDGAIPGDQESTIRSVVGYGDERQYGPGRRFNKEHVGLFPNNNPNSEFAGDGLNNRAAYAGTMTIEKAGTEVQVAVPGRFSMYYPSVAWPFVREDGRRYTVLDLAEEPIESNWLGTKPWIEYLTDTKLDRMGALPGFRTWGDVSLGGLAMAPVVIVGGVAILLAGPALKQAGVTTLKNLKVLAKDAAGMPKRIVKRLS